MAFQQAVMPAVPPLDAAPEEEEEEEEERGSGSEAAGEPGFFNPQEHFVVTPNGSPTYNYSVLNLTVPVSGNPALAVPTVVITEIEHQLLIAIPSKYWHRTVASRLLPPKAINKAISAAVVGSSEHQREEADPSGEYIRIWIGFLNPELEVNLATGQGFALESAFPSEKGQLGLLPFADALVAVADDKFSFLSAESGHPEDPAVSERLAKLEEAVVSIKDAVLQLSQKSQPPQPQPGAKSKATPALRPPDKNTKAAEDGFARPGSRSCKISPPGRDRTRPIAEPKPVPWWEETSRRRRSSFQRSDSKGPFQRARRSRRRGCRGSHSRDCPRSPSRCHAGSSFEADDNSRGFDQKPQKVVLGRLVRRFASVTGFVILQFICWGKLQEACCRASQPPESLERKPIRALSCDGIPYAGRLWLSRDWTRRSPPGQARFEAGQSIALESRTSVVLFASSGQFVMLEGGPSARSPGSLDSLVRSGRPGGGGQRAVGVGGGGFFGGDTPFFVLFSSQPTRLLRRSAYQTLAARLGRSLHAQGPGDGRLCRAEVKIGEEKHVERCEPERGAAIAESQSKEERKRRKEGSEQERRGGPRGGQQLMVAETALQVSAVPKPDIHAKQPETHQARHVPGSNASTVKVDQWWNSAFRLNMQFGSTFGSFLRSFHRKPASFVNMQSTASMWPMPLPFPWVLVKNGMGPSASGSKFTLQKGVNLVVATLNWLHLRRPSTCPLEICLHAKPNKVQWRVVMQIERTLEAWNLCEPVTAASMGRSAAKS